MKCSEGQKLISVQNNHETVYKISCILNLDSNHLTSDKYETVITQDSGIYCIYELRHVISNNMAFWPVYTQTSLCSLLLSLETPNDVQSVA